MKLEIDLSAHEKKLREVEAARESVRIAKNRIRTAETDLYNARQAHEDHSKRLAQAEGDLATEFLKLAMPVLNVPQPDTAAQSESEGSNG